MEDFGLQTSKLLNGALGAGQVIANELAQYSIQRIAHFPCEEL